ncbi:MAG: hypothetical protein ACHBN1_07140 [Heteroscytonema crispum UTEX LB 1556]
MGIRGEGERARGRDDLGDGCGRQMWGVGDKETTNHQRPFGRTSTRSVTKSAVRASPPTTNQQPLTLD